MTLRHRIRFYQQLAVLARAGVPLRSSLERLKDRFSGREVGILGQKINAGEPVGDAFTAAGFSPFECNLVAAGERSARLDSVYQHLADFWSRQLDMFGSITRHLYYPFIVLNLAVLVGDFIELVSSSWPVVIVHIIVSFAWLYGIGFILYTILRVSWQSEAAQAFWLRVPLIGRTFSTAYAYRWITALRIEYGAGVPMPNAAADAWRASGYAGREQLAREAEQALREGAQLSALVQGWRRLPSDWVDFIETGEISGALDAAFENLEAEAARSWKIAQDQMTQWVPKILYFLILLIVGIKILFLAMDVWQKNVGGPLNDALKQINP
ncbi:MAG: type II secretion system F family protein [Methylacidiphilales bacterium]|nr:type II secretion system F family protein [Candidatus Methylacidiphilales bacterium]